MFGGLLAKGLQSPWLWAYAAFLCWLVAGTCPRALVSRQGALWGLWLVWAAVAARASSQPLAGLERLSVWGGSAAFLLCARTLWGEGERRAWFLGLCAVSVVLAAAAYWTGPLRGLESNEMTGLLPPHYGYTAFALGGVSAAALGALGHRGFPAGASRTGLWALAAFLVATLLAARARGALAALAGAAAVLSWRRGSLASLGRPAIALALGAACVTGAWMAVQEGAGPAYLLKLDKAFRRPQLWAASLSAAADHPVLGEGPGNFAVGFRRHNFPSDLGWARYEYWSAHAHSEPLQAAVETGWPGLALLLLALASCARPAPSQGGSWTREAGLGAFAAMSLHLLVENALHRPGLSLLYFSAAACAFPAPERGPAPPRWALPAAQLAAGLGLALALTAWYPGWLARRLESAAASSSEPGRRLALLTRAVRILPAEPELRQALARAHLLMPRPDPRAALRELEAASLLDPTKAWPLMARAQLHWGRGERERAAELAEKALELEPRFLGARLMRATVLADRGRLEEARAELSEVERLQGEAPEPRQMSHYARRLAEVHGPALEALRRRLRDPRRVR